jgi:hypothetical protein
VRRPNHVLQRQGRPLAAAPCPAGRVDTGLAAFGRINSVQPDALTADLDGVGVDDGRDATDVGMRKSCDYDQGHTTHAPMSAMLPRPKRQGLPSPIIKSALMGSPRLV